MPVKPKTQSSTKTKEEPVIRLGIMGSGDIAAKARKVTLAEAVAGLQGTPHFVVPVTKELFTDGVQAVTDLLLEQEIPYDAVSNPAAAKVRALKPYLSNAANVLNRERGYNKYFIQTIGDDGKLLVLFAEDDEGLDATMQLAFEAEIPVLAFNQGLDELEAADDDETEAEDEEEADDDEEVEADEDDEDDEDVEAEDTEVSTNGTGDVAGVLRAIGQALIDTAKGL